MPKNLLVGAALLFVASLVKLWLRLLPPTKKMARLPTFGLLRKLLLLVTAPFVSSAHSADALLVPSLCTGRSDQALHVLTHWLCPLWLSIF